MDKVYMETTRNRTYTNVYKLEETSRISVLTCDVFKERKCGHGMVKNSLQRYF